MKLFLKILAGFIILITLVLVGLNIYFTDERLKSMILPEVREMVGTDVQVEEMSLTFFKTFPSLGVELNDFVLPDPEGNPVATLDELVVGVELFPLMSSEISISELELSQPILNYHVYEDSSSNIDFLMEMAESPDETEEEEPGYAINIPQFTIEDAIVNYRDDTGIMFIELEDLDADISLEFDDLIKSTIDAELGSLSAMVDSTKFVEDLALSLNQTSTIDLDNEQLELSEGVLSIRGLALNISGNISTWSENPALDLQFSSNSDNFGELLRLVPPEYEEYVAELETEGSLNLEGSISGTKTDESIPDFDLTLNVQDGYLKNPDLPEAIQDIQISLTANNELVTIEEFQANAAENDIQASGTVERPLEDDATFSLDFDGDVDLATISQFYPIEEFGIQELNGTLAANATANGNVSVPEEAEFSGNFILEDGILQYEDVPQAIQNINAIIQASQDQINIENVEFTAAENNFSMSGTVSNPLDENNRSVNLSADLDFDLATIKDFYPIDEDTLTVRGQLAANVNLRGNVDPDQLEQLLQESTFQLQNGYIRHESIAKPLEDLTLSAEATGTRLNIQEASFNTGENTLAMNGTVSNYLSEDPQINLNVEGDAVLSDISAYYSLEPWIQELTGSAELDLRATGPVGDITQLQLNGAMNLSDVNAAGDSIPQPITDLQSTLSLTPNAASLNNFSMNFGSSDIKLEGKMQNYMGMLAENPNSNNRPNITGSYQSDLLNLDEMIDWDAEEDADSDEPILIELPEMNASVDASINRLIIFGMEVTDISGTGKMNPNEIRMENAEATLFEGTATGNLIWEVPQPDNTNMSFSGSLSNLTAEAFFRETGFLGEDSNIHQYLTGAFSADVEYSTDLDETMSPNISTTDASGSFGMTRARLNGHPIQEGVADLLKVNELSSLALDSWESTFNIANEVLTFENFNITSEDIGLELDGTMNLTSDNINFNATLSLPERFKRGVSNILPDRAADALQRDDGTIAVPLKITGTMENPRVREDDTLIKELIQDYVKEQGGNLLDRLFDN